MPIEILQTQPMIDTTQQALGKSFVVHRYFEAADKAAMIAEIGPRIRGIACQGPVSGELINALPNLEIIACFGVGYDAVDVAAAKARKVRVTNTPDVLNDAVAELTLGMMIALARHIPQADRFVRDGRWEKEKYPLFSELTGKTVGILGLGRIGKEIATRCQAMKMRVVYHGRREQPNLPFPYYADLEAMARDCDWLVVIAPGGQDTKGIVSRKVLEALGPEGRIVNMARGSLIDEVAMVEMLQSGALGGAALDVFVDEPKVPQALFGLENVVLSPHQGSATRQTREQMGQLVVGNLLAHFERGLALTPVV
ncbi:Lactate dehydrogenase [Devosia enhydra]|uniref:Lactate dehydrogenase n=1 Tax=Devosia enhydra TaxID=665118 RepID=A0A1K2I1Q7_9HYPH|nr:2-hydroxyacid dehydrogenase [Devosia enhydra]SFZ86191.1 Lactate dehydrogenase [Devosia enhydra]